MPPAVKLSMDKNTSLRWLTQAKNDLKWTKANITQKIYYGACFTAQQAAEKALKAFLISKGKRIRVHDLGAILQQCKKFDLSFEKLRQATATLTDYYLETRYPDISEFIDYNYAQAKEALESASEILEFVETKLK